MISGQQVPSYAHSEFAEAFRHYIANGSGEPPREFMASWFASRYPDAKERDHKFQVFAAICDYLSEFRESLIAGGVITPGPDGRDIVPGSLTAILISHYRVELTTPKPEQVITACRKRLDDYHTRT